MSRKLRAITNLPPESRKRSKTRTSIVNDQILSNDCSQLTVATSQDSTLSVTSTSPTTTLNSKSKFVSKNHNGYSCESDSNFDSDEDSVSSDSSSESDSSCDNRRRRRQHKKSTKRGNRSSSEDDSSSSDSSSSNSDTVSSDSSSESDSSCENRCRRRQHKKSTKRGNRTKSEDSSYHSSSEDDSSSSDSSSEDDSSSSDSSSSNSDTQYSLDIDKKTWPLYIEHNVLRDELENSREFHPEAYLQLNKVNRSSNDEFDLDSGFEHLPVKATILKSTKKAYDKFFINRAYKNEFEDCGEQIYDIISNIGKSGERGIKLSDVSTKHIICKLVGKDLDEELEEVDWNLFFMCRDKTNFLEWTSVDKLNMVQVPVGKSAVDPSVLLHGGYSTAINDEGDLVTFPRNFKTDRHELIGMYIMKKDAFGLVEFDLLRKRVQEIARRISPRDRKSHRKALKVIELAKPDLANEIKQKFEEIMRKCKKEFMVCVSFKPRWDKRKVTLHFGRVDVEESEGHSWLIFPQFITSRVCYLLMLIKIMGMMPVNPLSKPAFVLQINKKDKTKIDLILTKMRLGGQTYLRQMFEEAMYLEERTVKGPDGKDVIKQYVKLVPEKWNEIKIFLRKIVEEKEEKVA
ncbi:predicted protein [Chaetoceros tenuissimus]|uniref:Uncharacterized protein n=1 Tax=Chaetoceros tenuissimus TaxID=426638 RepID=A0AAD3DD48_9STRA|nr:predicted protein [Chaetoceros tenuissimus]